MTASIREAKSKLSELIDSAERGEEVIITAHGKPRARIVPIPEAKQRGFDMVKLRRLAKRGSTGKKGGPDSTQIIGDLREDPNMTYLDSGILLKLYLTEPDSDLWRDRLDARTDLVSSTLALLEVKCGLRQKMKNGFIRRKAMSQFWLDFRDSVDVGILRLLPLSTDVIEDGTRLLDELPATILLRALDACHLATARFHRCDRVATSDARMRAAASAVGIRLLL